jgi:hypothetical protein
MPLTEVVMTRDSLYENDIERQQHAHAIHVLAEEITVPKEEISNLYEDVLIEYKREAKIKIFLPILVPKRVKEFLDKSGSIKPPHGLSPNSQYHTIQNEIRRREHD